MPRFSFSRAGYAGADDVMVTFILSRMLPRVAAGLRHAYFKILPARAFSRHRAMQVRRRSS